MILLKRSKKESKSRLEILKDIIVGIPFAVLIFSIPLIVILFTFVITWFLFGFLLWVLGIEIAVEFKVLCCTILSIAGGLVSRRSAGGSIPDEQGVG